MRQVASTPKSPIKKTLCDETTTENTTLVDIENISVMISNAGNVTIVTTDDSESSAESEDLLERVDEDDDESDFDSDR